MPYNNFFGHFYFHQGEAVTLSIGCQAHKDKQYFYFPNMAIF
jgi:hypothetical protein